METAALLLFERKLEKRRLLELRELGVVVVVGEEEGDTGAVLGELDVVVTNHFGQRLHIR